MKKIFRRYRELIGIIWSSSKFAVISTFAAAIILGLCQPLSISVNAGIFNQGLRMAQGQAGWNEYIPLLILFVALNLLPTFVGDLFIFGFIQPKMLLIFRTDFRAKLLKKLEKLDYRHFEDKRSVEIMDKAFNQAENSARHMFPMYVSDFIGAVIGGAGILALIGRVRWWLVLCVLIPFLVETRIRAKQNYDIYKELQTYWNKERRYSVLGSFLRRRNYVYENYLNQSSDYLIDTYKSRVRARNQEYERYYFKHLRHNLLGDNLTQIAPVIISALFLALYLRGVMDIGTFISLTSAMFASVYQSLNWVSIFFRASAMHIANFEYYDKFFDLSETESGTVETLPESFDIEFRDVHFTYPGTGREVLKGMSFTIRSGQAAALIGKNGEGKTTIIKLLLGLFEPDSGQILVGGRPLREYSAKTRRALFGAVMQDFLRVCVPLSENIELGDLEKAPSSARLKAAMDDAGVSEFLPRLPHGASTLIGREFEGGVDVSGGQWQRIAIARALYAGRPVLILDEPTNQLDPMAESKIYRDFASISNHKTTLLISHRLGSTAIADNIIVIDGGKVAEQGNHAHLMAQRGVYAQMYESQREWYIKDGAQGEADA